MTPAYQEGYDAGQRLCSLGVKSGNPKEPRTIDRIDWDEGYNDACADFEASQEY